MIILEDNKLSGEFLTSAALSNARSIFRLLFPNDHTKFHSRSALAEHLGDGELTVTPAQFRAAMWSLMEEGVSGSFHLALSTMGDGVTADEIATAFGTEKGLVDLRTTIETGQSLDLKLLTDASGDKELRFVYIGEAEAEIHAPEKDYEDEQEGYSYKAYRHVVIPVLSNFQIGPNSPYIQILTKAIHQNVATIREVDGLRTNLESAFNKPFPPLLGLADGIKALWRTEVFPKQFDVEDGDGTKARWSSAPGVQNQSTRDVEDAISTWDFKKGSMVYEKDDLKVPFKVDIAHAIFSFGAKTTVENADEVIRRIIAAS